MSTEKSQKSKAGRPPVLGDQGTVSLTVRLSRQQADAVEKAAKRSEKDKSEWVRNVLSEAVQAA